MRKPEYRIVLPRIDDLQELNVMLAERLEEWAHAYKAEGKAEGQAEGKAEGKVEGRAEGAALALQKLLQKRFGAVPPLLLARISSASLDQLEVWLDQVFDASSLDDLFGRTGS